MRGCAPACRGVELSLLLKHFCLESNLGLSAPELNTKFLLSPPPALPKLIRNINPLIGKKHPGGRGGFFHPFLHPPPAPIYFLSLNGLLLIWQLISSQTQRYRSAHGRAHPRAGDGLVAPAVITLRIEPASATSLNHSEHQLQQVPVGFKLFYGKIDIQMHIYLFFYFYFFSLRSLQAFSFGGWQGFC